MAVGKHELSSLSRLPGDSISPSSLRVPLPAAQSQLPPWKLQPLWIIDTSVTTDSQQTFLKQQPILIALLTDLPSVLNLTELLFPPCNWQHTHQGPQHPHTQRLPPAHTHLSELLLLDTADSQVILETILTIGFGDAILPCFSFPLELFFPNFSVHVLGLVDTRAQRRRYTSHFSVGISFLLMASAIT